MALGETRLVYWSTLFHPYFDPYYIHRFRLLSHSLGYRFMLRWNEPKPMH